MKLHTNFHDYYDYAVGYGIDDNVHYNRITKEVEIRPKPQFDFPQSAQLFGEWHKLLEAVDEVKLNETVSVEIPSEWGSVISHINLHNAHHGGQIVILRKLQGSWDASKGVS